MKKIATATTNFMNNVGIASSLELAYIELWAQATAGIK